MRKGSDLRKMMAAVALVAALGGCKGEAPQEAASSAPEVTATPQAPVSGPERHIVALGDSLLAGYGLRPEQAYPPRLEAALRAAGVNAFVVNAGVSGDTTADGLARIDFTLGSTTPDLVLLSLGGNDMLRGLSRRRRGPIWRRS
jgi:acyl-CoA thioesterase-1